LERIASGGYGYNQRYDAFAELVAIYSANGEMERTVQAYASLFPQWNMNKATKALFALANSVNSQNFAAFRKAVLDDVIAHPDRDANSQLLGLCSEIATKIGQSESVSALCAEAKVDKAEKSEADAWTGLIQDWELAGPFISQKNDEVFPPETEYLKNTTGSKWTKLDPKDVLGIVFVQPALALKDEELNGRVVYARTELESAVDRPVTFSAGSDDWIKVWVNGEEVHSSMSPRSISLDQDRFRANLQKGKNTILLKVGNIADSWAFCLRVLPEEQSQTLTALK